MEVHEKIESMINKVKEWNQEAGNTLHEQMHTAQNSEYSNSELAELIKSEEDVADMYYCDEDIRHGDIREIQDAIINNNKNG